MMDVQGYLIRLTAAAILAALIRDLAPEGGVGRAARLGAGLMVLLAALGPLARANPLAAARELVRGSYGDPMAAEPFDQEVNGLLSGLISQQAEAYILDKAGALSARIEPQVETKVDGRYPVPWRVRIRGEVTPRQRAALAECIAQDLGIPEERQEW